MRAVNARRIGYALVAGGAAALWLACAAAPAAAYSLSRVVLETKGSEATLRVEAAPGTALLPCRVARLDHPCRIVVDLRGADAPVPLEGWTAESAGPVEGVRSSVWSSQPMGRLVRYLLTTSEPVDFKAEPVPGGLIVRMHPEGQAEALGPAEALVLPTAAASAASAFAATSPPASDAGSSPAGPAALAEEVFPGVPPSTAVEPMAAPVAALPIGPEPQDAAPPLGGVDAAAMAAGSTLPAQTQIDSRRMNLEFQGAEIRNILHSIAEFAGTNIVADRDIEGPMTIRLFAVPWHQALDVVCESAGLVTVEGDGVIRVATQRALREEGIEREAAARRQEELLPLETRIFTARYASAKELKESVVFALSKRGSAQVDERTNAILVNDIAARLDDIGQLIASLDTETRQVEIVARLVDVDNTAARQIGIDWSLENLHSTSERVSGSVNLNEGLIEPSVTARVGLVRSFGNVDAMIDALERSNKATIISNPKITTVNNRQARILVGKEIPLITLDEAGNPVTELKKVGITLEVTPYINKDNRITMDLHPEVSDLSSQATVQGGLIFTTTLADTRVMVNNGETAVIGGLIRTGETDFSQGIPVLRSIPLLGHLFGSTDTRKESRELLIFITPRVVEGMAQNQP